MRSPMNHALLTYIQSLPEDGARIAEKRKAKLRELSAFIRSKSRRHEPAKLNFICTHNSRRSHLCQVWTATLAVHLELRGIETYSGGTEATAFNPRAVAALRRAGFTIEAADGANPRYRIAISDRAEPWTCYSKRFDDPVNPARDFAAVMTCADADRNCAVVPGAEVRLAIPYQDPKEADDTPAETRTYDERCRQIAGEMYFMLTEVEQG